MEIYFIYIYKQSLSVIMTTVDMVNLLKIFRTRPLPHNKELENQELELEVSNYYSEDCDWIHISVMWHHELPRSLIDTYLSFIQLLHRRELSIALAHPLRGELIEISLSNNLNRKIPLQGNLIDRL